MDVDKIWIDYSSRIKAFLRTKISNQSHIDDLSQEIWVRVVKGIGSLRSEDKVKYWVFQIASNAITDYYRKDRPIEDVEFDQIPSSEEEVEVSSELSKCILPFIRQLPEDEANLLSAIEIEGLTQTEYAKKHGIKYSTLKSRVQKSRESLRRVFEDCCSFSFDSQGNLMDFQSKSVGCKKC